MRLDDQAESENVEDRRSGGPGGGMVFAGGGVGTLILIVLYLVLGGDPMALFQPQANNPNMPPAQQAPGPGAAPGQEKEKIFVSKVLGSTEEVWTDIFRQEGRKYRKPTLVLFSGQVQSACGFASAASGPFYCPGDEKVYIDLSFYQQLRNEFGAPGDFAQAYVIAHEVGHHVQKLLGISERVSAEQARSSQKDANRLSVRLELQADFFAGVWAHHANEMRHILEAGDIEEGLRAASAIGDDRLQKQSRGYVVPDSFTHGSSEQRVRWFRRGLETGDLSQGDTFGAEEL